MSAENDIKVAIDRIDQRIAKLQQIRQMLMDEFAIEPTSAKAAVTMGTPTVVATAPTPRKTNSRRTRRDEMIDLVEEHGPQRSREMIEKLGIPGGTVHFELRNRDVWTRLDDGRWALKVSREERENPEAQAPGPLNVVTDEKQETNNAAALTE